MKSESKYKAFISYSHKDKAIATWLHKQLDGYLPPAKLGDAELSVPRRGTKRSRWRVFLDAEEFEAAGDLKDRIRTALVASESLIVICSVDSARSEYVNEEIKLFKQVHGSKRVFAMIVRGKPHDAEQECFPKALKTAFGPDGTDTGKDEPIAADLQVFPRRQVANKLIAGILDVSYGDFVDRENARRLRRILWTGGIAVSVALLLVVAGAIAVLQAREATRNQADSFIQQGQRAAAAASLPEAEGFFRKALAVADSPIARAGLIGTVEVPIAFESEWQATPDAEGKLPELTSVAFIDDEHVAIGDKSGRVRVIALKAGTVRWTCELDGQVNALSFAHARNQLAAGLENGKIIWLAQESGAVISQSDMSFPIRSLRHDPQGRLMTIGMNNPGGVVVLDEEGKRAFELQHSAGSVQGVAFNKTGDTIYWGGSSNYVWACALQGGCDPVTEVEEWVYAIDGSPDRRFTAFATGGKIEFFDHAMRKQQTLSETRGHVFALRFDPSSRYLATAGQDRSLTLHDVRAQRTLVSIPGAHRREIYAVEFSPSGDRLVSVGLDGRATIWRIVVKGAVIPPHRNQPLGIMLTAHQRNRITDVRIVRDNGALVSTWDQQDPIVKLDPKAQEGALPNQEEFKDRLAMSLDLARASIFHPSEFSLSGLWWGEEREIPSEVKAALARGEPDKQRLALSRDRKMLSVVDSSGRAHLFVKALEQTRVFETGERPILTSALMPTANLLLLGYDGGEVVGYDIRSYAKRFAVTCGYDPLLFLLEDRSRQRFIAVTKFGPICIFDISGQKIVQRDEMRADTIALSPDEVLLARAGIEGEVILMSAADLSEITRFKGHRGAVHALHFTLDSKQLVSGGADETLRVWPAAKARHIATASIHDLRREYPSPEPLRSRFDIVGWLQNGH
jgi:WD40 repeat protein